MLTEREAEKQERRATNLIWNGAGDYSIKPDIRAYDRNGYADIYMNTVIGAIHRYYDYPRISNYILGLSTAARVEDYTELLWLGLENGAYLRLEKERPAIMELRRGYAQSVAEQAAHRAPKDLRELDRIKLAHYKRALGEEIRIPERDRKILQELEDFHAGLDTEEILERMTRILGVYYLYFPANAKESRQLRLPRWLRLGRRYQKGLGASLRKGDLLKKKKWLPERLPGQRTPKEIRQSAEDFFGASIYSAAELAELEARLCRGNHQDSLLHYTRGETHYCRDSEARYHQEMVKLQTRKNRNYYENDIVRNRLSITRLTDKVRNCMLVHLEDSRVKSRSGDLRCDWVWRGVHLNDESIFSRPERVMDTELSVDILLDASTSQIDRQERVATQAYIVAQSLTNCGIPTRVSSFFSINGCTVLRIFRDYQESDKNQELFAYNTVGWNRDGLAFRALGHMMDSSLYSRRLLIILSDASPSDSMKLPAGEGEKKKDYNGEPAILDTASEVERLRRQGIRVMCIFTGEEASLPAARRIYGRELVRIHAIEQFADAVSGVLIGLIGNL